MAPLGNLSAWQSIRSADLYQLLRDGQDFYILDLCVFLCFFSFFFFVSSRVAICLLGRLTWDGDELVYI